MNNKILIASTNKDKISEIKKILNNPNYEFITLGDLNENYEVIENGKNYKENSLLKANYFYTKYHLPVIADDSGIEIKYLNNEPGINSHRYSGKGYLENNKLVLKKLKNTKNRKARFVTTICLLFDDKIKFFNGKLKGNISTEINGKTGFGYDSIFIPNKYKNTLAELGDEIKNKISSRSKALEKLNIYLNKNKNITSTVEKAILYNLKLITKLNKVKIVKRLEGGMSNYTYIVNINNKLFTYRLPGENAELFVDREIEKQNISLVDKLNINTKQIYLNTNNGIKISNYIDGVSLDGQTIFNFLPKVVEILNTLKNSNIKAVNDVNLVDKLNYYESLGTKNNETYNLIKNFFVSLYPKMEKTFSKTITHGDMQPSNFIASDDKLYLVDWEFAGNIDPLYDIACMGNINFNDSINLLTLYLKRTPNEEELFKLKYLRLQQALQWFQVATFKEASGLSQKLNINFEMVANRYLDESKKLYEELKK